ncbi:uncharacterized, partial [Tachysurus ichikawai]
MSQAAGTRAAADLTGNVLNLQLLCFD